MTMVAPPVAVETKGYTNDRNTPGQEPREDKHGYIRVTGVNDGLLDMRAGMHGQASPVACVHWVIQQVWQILQGGVHYR